MAGLVPAIQKHRSVRVRAALTLRAALRCPHVWMAGTSPAMTI